MSQSALTQRAKAQAILQDGHLVRLREFVQAGIAPETVSRLVREGTAVRLARGLYQLVDTTLDTQHTLAEAAALVPRGVLCLTSALLYHDLTLHMPRAVWMAIDRAGWKPRIEYPPIRFVRFCGWTLADGIEHHKMEGVEVKVFDPAKTIVDCFRYRHKIGHDIALEGLKEGLRQRRATPDQLWHFAQQGHIWSVMRPYVEAMIVDGA